MTENPPELPDDGFPRGTPEDNFPALPPNDVFPRGLPQAKIGLPKTVAEDDFPLSPPSNPEERSPKVLAATDVLRALTPHKKEGNEPKRTITPEGIGRVVKEAFSPKIDVAKKAVKHVVQNPGEAATQAVLASRESRKRLEARQGRPANKLQKFFRKGLVGWTAQTLVQSIPSPIGYGPGDVITAWGALTGTDALTGEKLDVVDRVLYGVATTIPFVPGTFLTGPARLLRRGIEDLTHGHATGNKKEQVQALNDIREGVTSIKNTSPNRPKNQPPQPKLKG